MKKFLAAAMALAAILNFSLARPAAASIKANCWGKVIVYAGNSLSGISNPIIDYGSLHEYSTQYGHTKDCEDLVSARAAQDGNFNNKTWLCQQIHQAGQFRVTAYAKVGTHDYTVAQSIYVNCSGGVRTCTCPTGWLSNTSNVAGGITADGACKKAACNGNMISPFPPNGTQIGTWGFSWGNAFFAWGTAANGGAATCVTTPWVGT